MRRKECVALVYAAPHSSTSCHRLKSAQQQLHTPPAVSFAVSVTVGAAPLVLVILTQSCTTSRQSSSARIMLPESRVLPPSHTVLHSADHVRLVAAFLHIDELMHASSLSRASHPLFDGDGVWDSRLRRAEAIQHVDDVPVPAAAVLSAAQLAALPSLPTLSDAAALCLQSYIAVEVPRVQDVPPTLSSEEAVQRCRAARVTAIVHLPSTLLYHARISKPDGWDKACTVGYYEFAFAWSGEEQRWRVDRMGERYSGWRAMNVDDNVADDVVELTAETSNDEPAQLLRRAPTTARSTARRSNSSSSKQRYIELLGCSEHAHNGCHRLLPPSPPLDARCLAHYDYRALDGTPIVLPAVCPLPLCASCRTLVARCIQQHGSLNRSSANISSDYRVTAIARCNATMFDTAFSAADVRSDSWHRRVCIQYSQRGGEERKTGQEEDHHSGSGHSEAEGYEVVGEHGWRSHLCWPVLNVCKTCRRGLTRNGRGHSEECVRWKPDARTTAFFRY